MKYTSISFAILGVTVSLLASTGWSGEDTLESVRLDPEDERELLVLPDVANASNSSYELDDFDIVIEGKDDRVKYEAREKGKSNDPIVHWESVSDEPVRLVFNTKRKKFQRLTNTVRVVLDDYSELETLIDETDATRGKAYPSLGYAIVQLASEIHPAEFVKVVVNRAEVQSAFVMIERPREVPK